MAVHFAPGSMRSPWSGIVVWVHGVLWSARLQGEDSIGSDEQVRVVAEDGATLTVERHREEGEGEDKKEEPESGTKRK